MKIVKISLTSNSVVLNRTVSANLGVPLGVFVLAKHLEIHQEEPTTSENITDIDQFFKEVKEPTVESISNVFIGNNTGVFNVSKSNSEPKEHYAPAKTTQEIELYRRNSMAKKTREDMEYCLRIWREWRKCRNEQSQIINMTKVGIEQTLCQFVLEGRKKQPDSSILLIHFITSAVPLCAI